MRDAPLPLQWTLECSQASIGLTNNNHNMTKETVKKTDNRTRHLDARVTPEEHEMASRKAVSCGLPLSGYPRKCTLRHEPKLHLTERELETYCSLADARGPRVNPQRTQGQDTGADKKLFPK